MEQLPYTQLEKMAVKIEENLVSAREYLHEIDHEIFRLITARCRAAERIAVAKQKTGNPTIDEIQRNIVLARSQQWARDEGLDPEQIRKIFAILIQMNETAQKQLEKKAD